MHINVYTYVYIYTPAHAQLGYYSSGEWVPSTTIGLACPDTTAEQLAQVFKIHIVLLKVPCAPK